jgi:hypothetical protein
MLGQRLVVNGGAHDSTLADELAKKLKHAQSVAAVVCIMEAATVEGGVSEPVTMSCGSGRAEPPSDIGPGAFKTYECF